MGEKKYGDITAIIAAVAAIVFGILFCFINDLGDALVYIFGIGFILVGLASVLFLSLKIKRTLFTPYGFGGGAVIALGLTVVIWKDLLLLFIYELVPAAFIAFGAIFVAEAFIAWFYRNQKTVLSFVLELVAGGAMLILGVLAVAVDDVWVKFNIIEGILLIAAGIYLVLMKFILKSKEE